MSSCCGDEHICNCSTCSNFDPPTEEDLKRIAEEEEKLVSAPPIDILEELRDRPPRWIADFLYSFITSAYTTKLEADIANVLKYAPLVFDKNRDIRVDVVSALRERGITAVVNKSDGSTILALRYKESAFEAGRIDYIS